MRQARRPLVGDGQGYAASGQVLQQFIETTRIPVATEKPGVKNRVALG